VRRVSAGGDCPHMRLTMTTRALVPRPWRDFESCARGETTALHRSGSSQSSRLRGARRGALVRVLVRRRAGACRVVRLDSPPASHPQIQRGGRAPRRLHAIGVSTQDSTSSNGFHRGWGVVSRKVSPRGFSKGFPHPWGAAVGSLLLGHVRVRKSRTRPSGGGAADREGPVERRGRGSRGQDRASSTLLKQHHTPRCSPGRGARSMVAME
jgi:hypothetical protein